MSRALPLRRVMRREKCRSTAGGVRADDGPGRTTRIGIEPGRRLVEDDELRAAGERERHAHEPTLSAGETAELARP